MPFVLDASVTLAWCFEDETSPIADNVERRIRSAERPHVPICWAYEVANAVVAAERRRRLTPDAALRAMNLVGALPVVLDDPSLPVVWGAVLDAARAFGLSTYDAAYLELALREGLPLATLDRALERAARQAGVELLG